MGSFVRIKISTYRYDEFFCNIYLIESYLIWVLTLLIIEIWETLAVISIAKVMMSVLQWIETFQASSSSSIAIISLMDDYHHPNTFSSKLVISTLEIPRKAKFNLSYSLSCWNEQTHVCFAFDALFSGNRHIDWNSVIFLDLFGVPITKFIYLHPN